MVMKGQIKSLDDVYRINKVATKQNFQILFSSKNGNEEYDAKSFVCLVGLIGKEVNIIAEDTVDHNEFRNAVKKMKI